jgi:hypothetical protein
MHLLALGAAIRDFYNLVIACERCRSRSSSSGRRSATVWRGTTPRRFTSPSHYRSGATGGSFVRWRNASTPGG